MHHLLLKLSDVFVCVSVPSLATAVTDPSCFLTKFTGVQATPGNSFDYQSCAQFDYNTGYCSEFAVMYNNHDFLPAFTYNFQCSSQLLVDFIPVFIYTYALYFISSSVISIIFCRLERKSLPRFLLQDLPAVIWPKEVEDGKGMLVRLENIIVTLMSGFTILLTFGMASPVLAAVVVLSMVAQTVEYQVLYKSNP